MGIVGGVLLSGDFDGSAAVVNMTGHDYCCYCYFVADTKQL